MRLDLPTPDQVLEELAGRVATQIDKLAPVSFDAALDELIRQHAFLLAVNAARAPDGMPFNFAEVSGGGWSAPHNEWLRQYIRLYERAAGRIPDDRSFFAKLTRVPIRLLPAQDGPRLSRAVLEAIIDLGPTFVHRLESWVSKRTVVETSADESAVARQKLAGADSRAYSEVVVDVVGAWEHLLQYGIASGAQRRKGRQTAVEHWGVYREEWPLLWRHLCDTAHMLAAAVWNEDEIGARRYSDMLVRWRTTLGRDDYELYLLNRRLVFPTLFEMSWQDADKILKPMQPIDSGELNVEHLAGTIARGAHDDVLLLTAAILIDWTISEKQLSNIGAKTGEALLRRTLVDADDRHDLAASSFRSVFLDILRIDLAGERFQESSYGEELDTLVMRMDNMTERRVVTGRIDTPSTHHQRSDLTFAFLAILMMLVPEQGDDGFVTRVAELAADDAMLPQGDRSLRGVDHMLDSFARSLETPWPQWERVLRILRPGAEPRSLMERLSAIVGEARATIEKRRAEKLIAKPIDAAKIERMRLTIEAALLAAPGRVPIFQDYTIVSGVGPGGAGTFSVVFNGISKASLVEPPMEIVSSNFVEHLADTVASSAGKRVWGLFAQREREKISIGACVEDEAFWLEIAKLTPRISGTPTLIVSRAAEGRAVRRLLYPADGTASNLKVERRAREGKRNEYIATVEGVDVFGGDFPRGESWLFSGAALRAVYYSPIRAGEYVTLVYEPESERDGALRAQFEQAAEWSDDPIFEIHAHDRAAEED